MSFIISGILKGICREAVWLSEPDNKTNYLQYIACISQSKENCIKVREKLDVEEFWIC